MGDAPRSVSFMASLPPIVSAISVSGDKSGARMKIDIPDCDADVIPLIQIYFSGKAFRVTLELEEDSLQNRDEQKHAQVGKRTKRQSEWTRP